MIFKTTIKTICLLLILISSIVYATDSVSFRFKNSTDQTVIVYLYWLDHDLDYPGPVNLAGGEMKPGQEWEIQHNYKPGKYVIIWRSLDSEIIKVIYPKQTSGLIIDELMEE